MVPVLVAPLGAVLPPKLWLIDWAARSLWCCLRDVVPVVLVLWWWRYGGGDAVVVALWCVALL